jgi:hypothetical protein
MNPGTWRATSRRVLSAGSLVMLLVVGSPIGAAAHGPDPTLSGSFFGQDQALAFRWRSGSEPPTTIKTAIKAAAAAATSTRASQAATLAYDSGGPNPIGYGAGNTCGPNGIACFTRNPPTGFTLWLREQGHAFDWGSLRWCQSYADPPFGCFDAETIALDEFGHVEGLDHHVNYTDERDYDDAIVQTFSRARPEAGWNTHRFGTCDIATLQREYDVPNTSARISTCLDLDTLLTIAASPMSIAYAASTTLTATLKIAGTTSYDRLRGNPVSGRTVSLQRRPAGGTTWTTIGTMTVGASGTYRLSVKLLSATAFRAVFKTPSDEGLTGDTSSSVSVAVGTCMVGPCPLFGRSPS